MSAAKAAFVFEGYHCFGSAEEDGTYGRFEVFEVSEVIAAKNDFPGAGWYWLAGFPGCLPDGDPMGPFPSAEDAYWNAMEGGG